MQGISTECNELHKKGIQLRFLAMSKHRQRLG